MGLCVCMYYVLGYQRNGMNKRGRNDTNNKIIQQPFACTTENKTNWTKRIIENHREIEKGRTHGGAYQKGNVKRNNNFSSQTTL